MVTDADTKETKPLSIQDLLNADKAEDEELDLDPAILKAADLGLPQEFKIEAMAEELLEHISSYHKAKAANQAARHSGDHVKAEQMYRLMAFSRLAAAIIQAENPGVKAIADDIGFFRAKRVREQRDALKDKE